MRLIDADKLMQIIPTEEYNARMAITYVPTVDAEPVNHGHWISIGSMHRCSVCDETVLVPTTIANKPIYEYCPVCGAKMDEVEEDDYEEPEINPCRGCEDYDGKGGCLSKGGCGERREDETN